MYEETTKKLKEYQIQIVVSFFIIIAVLISINVVNDLYYQTKTGDRNPQIQKNIYKKSKISSLIYLCAGLYFLYITFKSYMKNKTKSNLMFLIASELALVAALIRFMNIRKNDVSNEGDII